VRNKAPSRRPPRTPLQPHERRQMRWFGGGLVAICYFGNILLAHTQYGFHDPHPAYPNGWAFGTFPHPHAVWEFGRWYEINPLWIFADFFVGALSVYGGSVVGDWIVRRDPYWFRSANVLLFVASMVLGGLFAAVVRQGSVAKAMFLWFAIIGQIAPCLALAGLASLLRNRWRELPARSASQ
jgi:hypothetical protein